MSEEQLRTERAKVKELHYRCQELQKTIEKMKIKGVFPADFQNGFEKIKKSCGEKDHEIKKMKRKQS